MSIERLLEPENTGLPDCRCGKEMKVFSRTPSPDRSDSYTIRIYKCPSCQHEMRLTVWTEEALA
jgi:hypothetical protein